MTCEYKYNFGLTSPPTEYKSYKSGREEFKLTLPAPPVAASCNNVITMTSVSQLGEKVLGTDAALIMYSPTDIATTSDSEGCPVTIQVWDSNADTLFAGGNPSLDNNGNVVFDTTSIMATVNIKFKVTSNHGFASLTN